MNATELRIRQALAVVDSYLLVIGTILEERELSEVEALEVHHLRVERMELRRQVRQARRLAAN